MRRTVIGLFKSLDPDNLSSPGIFEPGKVKPESGSLEVSVFRIGIMMEKASMDFYRQAAIDNQTGEIKNLCK